MGMQHKSAFFFKTLTKPFFKSHSEFRYIFDGFMLFFCCCVEVFDLDFFWFGLVGFFWVDFFFFFWWGWGGVGFFVLFVCLVGFWFFINWARNRVITDVAVVMALIEMSGRTEEIFLIGTTTVPPPQ